MKRLKYCCLDKSPAVCWLQVSRNCERLMKCEDTLLEYNHATELVDTNYQSMFYQHLVDLNNIIFIKHMQFSTVFVKPFLIHIHGMFLACCLLYCFSPRPWHWYMMVMHNADRHSYIGITYVIKCHFTYDLCSMCHVYDNRLDTILHLS